MLTDAQFTSQYTLFFNPRISVGYRFRYLNYARQSGAATLIPTIIIRIACSYLLTLSGKCFTPSSIFLAANKLSEETVSE